MDSAGVSGLARLVMYRRERAVLLEPRDKGIVLWTLRYGDEVRDEKDYFSAIEANKPEKKMLTMVRSLIKNKTEDWNEQLLTDPVQKNLKRMIAAKKKKTKPHAGSKRQANPSGGAMSLISWKRCAGVWKKTARNSFGRSPVARRANPIGHPLKNASL